MDVSCLLPFLTLSSYKLIPSQARKQKFSRDFAILVEIINKSEELH